MKQAIPVLSIYWFLIIIKCKLQNVKIYQIHLEMGLYLGELIIGGGGGGGSVLISGELMHVSSSLMYTTVLRA